MEDRFDLLAKALAGQLSRRAALRSAAGAAAGAVLSGIGLAGCDTDPTGPRASQSPEPQFNLSGGGGNLACAVFCARVAERVFNRCRADASLGRGLCTDCGANANLLCAGPSGQFLCCGPGLTCCSSGCADLQFDPNNCGACGVVCTGTGATCFEGTCVSYPGNCVPEGGFCHSSVDCCDPGSVCTRLISDPRFSVCTSGAGPLCAPQGGSCRTTADCCVQTPALFCSVGAGFVCTPGG